MRRERNLFWILFLWALAIGWIGLLFYFSGQTGEESGGLSQKLTQFVMRIFPALNMPEDTLEFLLRKLAHFGIFAVEGLLLGLAMMETFLDISVGLALAGMLCPLVAAMNEFHQSLVPGRNGNGMDVWIDSAGALCGIFVAMALFWLFNRRKMRVE